MVPKKTEFLDKSSKNIDSWPVFFGPWKPSLLSTPNQSAYPPSSNLIYYLNNMLFVVVLSEFYSDNPQ